MKWPKWLSRSKPAPPRARRRQWKGYAGAALTRLLSSWSAPSYSPNTELRYELELLRARSRSLEQDNAYGRRYVKLVESNVVGPGVMFQSRITTGGGTLNTTANDRVEKAWREWGRRGNCDVTAALSWAQVERLVIKSVCRDGEVLVRLVPNFQNPARFAVQILEADYLATIRNEELPDGGRIVMGVEVDRWGARRAYHLLKNHPGDPYSRLAAWETERVPASEILHVYLPERPGQLRGVPWCHAVMTDLKHLGAFEEAAIVAARIGASKMGFFQSEDGGEYGGEGAQDDASPTITSAEPGSFEQLPPGFKFEAFNPDYPHAVFSPFVKRALQKVASGLNVSYLSLSGDLEGTSYSSGRIGLIDERDGWKVLQEWLIDALHGPIFAVWIERALLSGTLALPYSDLAKITAPSWQPRRWAWVDPLKDQQANVEAINNRLKAPSAVVAETGEDYEDLCRQIERDAATRAKYGVADPVETKSATPGSAPAMPDDSPDDPPQDPATQEQA